MKAENRQAVLQAIASIRAHVQAIGNLSQASRDSDIPYRTLMKLKNLKTDITVSTLVTLCRAIGETPDRVLGLAPPSPSKAVEAARRAEEAEADRVRRVAAKIRADLDRLSPPEPGASKPPKYQP